VAEPNSQLKVKLYGVESGGVVDVASTKWRAEDLQSGTLTRGYLCSDMVYRKDSWAGSQIGLEITAGGNWEGLWLLDNVILMELMPEEILVPNGSFEEPAIDPNGFGVVPYMGAWTELDRDPLGSTNTGLFINTAQGSPDRLANATGLQLAFLGSQEGNGIEQVLDAKYSLGCAYRLSVGVGISWRFPPAVQDRLELYLFYLDDRGRHEISVGSVGPAGLSSSQLVQAVLYLPAVTSGDPWLGRPIGIGLRAAGQAGGFWVLDDVRLCVCGIADQ
jgi:hypothetical protein